MGKNQQLIKLFVVMLLGTAFIFSSSHFGAKAFEKLNHSDGKYSAGTMIGALDVSGKTEEEAQSLLEETYVDWVKDFSVKLQYGEEKAFFDVNQFHLNAKQTMDFIQDGQKNQAFITVNSSKVREQVEILFPQIKVSEIDFDKLTNNLNLTASQLLTSSHSFDLFNDYLLAEAVNKDAIINEAVITMGDVPLELQSLVENTPIIEIPVGSTFSLLEFAKKQQSINEDELNVLATGIYQAILPSNFTIVERNFSRNLPDYAQFGYEAKVEQTKNADLKFTNPNKGKYALELKLENNQLRVALKGQQFPYDFKIVVKDEQQLKPKTIIQYSPMLLPGKTKIQNEGMDGTVGKIYREIYQDGQLVKNEQISEDYYAPVYQVEIHGLSGSQSNVSTTVTNENQTDSTNTTQTTDSTEQTSDITTSQTEQQDDNDSDLWGKPNEQPK